MPGYPYTDPTSGASYWEADRDKAEILISTLLQGKTFPVVGDPPGWIKKEQEKYQPVDLPTPETLQELEEEVPPDTNPDSDEQIEILPETPPGDDSELDPGTAGPAEPEAQQPDNGNPQDQLPPTDSTTEKNNAGIKNNESIIQTQ